MDDMDDMDDMDGVEGNYCSGLEAHLDVALEGFSGCYGCAAVAPFGQGVEQRGRRVV
jgi:hypothetical protein